jgi:hypothetical protein
VLTRSAFGLTLLLAVVSVAHAQDQAKNLIVNPSLEEPLADTGLPAGWLSFQDPPDSCKISIVAGGHTGDKALLIEDTGKSGGVTTTRVPLAPGKRYLARGWVKIEGEPDATAAVQVAFADGKGEYLGTAWLGNATPAHEGWQCLSVAAHADDVPGAAEVYTSVSVSGKAKAWFDDLQLVEADPSPPGGNLLAGGNMEEIVDGRPVYWIPFTEPGKVGTLTASDEVPMEGKHCLCLKGDAQYVAGLGEQYRVDGTRAYKLTGFVRAVAGDALLQIGYSDAEDHHLGNSESLHVSGGDWEEVSVTTDFAAFPAATHFRVSVAAATGQVEAYFDDLRLVEQ